MSIEEVNGINHVVLRNMAGTALFYGILNKSAARIKVIEQEKKWKLKFTVAVTDAAKKVNVEHVEGTFLCKADRDNFENVYSE